MPSSRSVRSVSLSQLVHMAPPSRRQALETLLRDPRADESTVAAARQAALACGLAPSLAARFPEHFSDRFVLRGPLPGQHVAVPESTPMAHADRRAALADCVGHEALIRIERRNGDTDAHIGKLDFAHNGLWFSEMNLAKAKALLQAGDRIAIASHPDTNGHAFVRLGEHDRVVTAIPVDGPLPAIVNTHASRRINLRGRVEAVLRGEYGSRVDLTRAHEHILLEPDGTPRLLSDQYLVFDRDFVKAVKVEQNVLAAALCSELSPRLLDAIADMPLPQLSGGRRQSSSVSTSYTSTSSTAPTQPRVT